MIISFITETYELSVLSETNTQTSVNRVKEEKTSNNGKTTTSNLLQQIEFANNQPSGAVKVISNSRLNVIAGKVLSLL